MNYKHHYGLFLLLLACMRTGAAQEKIVYHKIYTGATDTRPVVIDLWNVSEGEKLIRETVDTNNRVVKLEFLRNGALSGQGRFPIARITYEYDGNKIIETAYDESEQRIYVDKHAAHYQSIYHLDDDGFIGKVERAYDFETIDPVWEELGVERPSRADLEKESEEYYAYFYKDKPLEVEFYKYSYYKLDGVYPVSKDYQLDPDYEGKYLDTWMEGGIEEGVKKLKPQ